MARQYFQFKPEGLAVYKDSARTALVDTISYDSLVGVSALSATAMVIRGKTAWMLLFRDTTNYSVEWQKALLILKNRDFEGKEELKEVELTAFFEPIKLRGLRSNYTFSIAHGPQATPSNINKS